METTINIVYIFIILNFITIITSTLPNSQPPKYTRIASHKGFVARLIYRTSPSSPFYDPEKSAKDIEDENYRISIARHHYFSQPNGDTNGDKKPESGISGVAPLSTDFVMEYYIGDPPVIQLGIPDTGAELIWLQCGPCDRCFEQITPLYYRTYSASYKPINCGDTECNLMKNGYCGPQDEHCQYNVSYLVGPRSKGELAKETMILIGAGGPAEDDFISFENVVFGCGFNNSGRLGRGFSGIVGLRNATFSLIGQFKGPAKFSYCHNFGSSGGFIRFGDEAKLLGGKTPLIPNSFGNYHVVLEGIKVEQVRVNLPIDFFMMKDDVSLETGVFIDSGSSTSVLQSEAFDAVVTTIKQMMHGYVSTRARFFDLCYTVQDLGFTRYSYSAPSTLPQLTLMFKDLPVVLPRDNIWRLLLDEDIYCLAIVRIPGNSLNIIGMKQQDNFNMGYDLAENLLYMKFKEGCGANEE